MFFYFSFLFIFNFSLINCQSLMNSNIDIHSGTNRIIHAALTDKDSGKIWEIQEKVSSVNGRSGHIEISSSDGQSSVFYTFNGKVDNKKRLVVHDNLCELYLYQTTWSSFIPGVTKPLTNLILLIGPSLLDRIYRFNWQNGDDEIVRGALMHSAFVNLDGKLNITLYYKSNLAQMAGVQQPSQIVFTGYNPDTLVDGEAEEKLILDIYLQSETSQSLSKLVQVAPGIGCPAYLNEQIPFPTLNNYRIHFIAVETATGEMRVIKEAHADETRQVLRLNELRYFTKLLIYDYGIGSYYYMDSNCQAVPIDLDAPGMDQNGQFSIKNLLWLSKTYSYLGEIIYEQRSEYTVHVWESIETNQAINDETYDKIVTTQYMSSSFKSDVFGYYSPVAATINGYKKDDKGSFVLSYTNHREFYDFTADLPDFVFDEAFQISDCFVEPEERLTLTFHITCSGTNDCIKHAENNYNEVRELFESSLLGSIGISSTRISEIEFIFQGDRIEADVTFLEAPTFDRILPSQINYIDTSSITILHSTVSDNINDCLKYHANFQPSGSAFVFCESNSICISTNNPEGIKEDRNKGTQCYIYSDPLKKMNKLAMQKSLSELHDHAINYLGSLKFSLNIARTAVIYQVSDVIAKNVVAEELVQHTFDLALYYQTYGEIDGVHTILYPESSSFGGCTHACVQSEEIVCESFSFCERDNKKECFLSSLTTEVISENSTSDYSCHIYAKNHLYDYSKQSSFKFKEAVTALTRISVDECANQCFNEPECLSFEFCGNKCSFGGVVKSTNIEFSSDCDIYIEKSSEKYSVTGSKLVTEIVYSELDLNMDQCAALCDDQMDCKSFNFCPKGKSISECQLTLYTIEDPKANTIESSTCHNYQINFKPHGNIIPENNPQIKVSGTSGGAAFGIIMLFMFIGLGIGFGGPFVYSKVKLMDLKTIEKTDNFEWSRQINVDEEDQSSI